MRTTHRLFSRMAPGLENWPNFRLFNLDFSFLRKKYSLEYQLPSELPTFLPTIPSQISPLSTFLPTVSTRSSLKPNTTFKYCYSNLISKCLYSNCIVPFCGNSTSNFCFQIGNFFPKSQKC